MSLGRATRVAVAMTLVSVACAGCRGARDNPEVDVKRAWIHQQAAEHSWYVREALNGIEDIDYLEGWYPPESDPVTGGGWRWMNKRSITRLRTHPDNVPATDMTITVYGWVPWESLGLRTSILEFSVNGHVLDTFEPSHESFVHTFFVPRFLLEQSDYVDFVIAATNTARPRGDWRDLGMATTGIVWKPAGV